MLIGAISMIATAAIAAVAFLKFRKIESGIQIRLATLESEKKAKADNAEKEKAKRLADQKKAKEILESLFLQRAPLAKIPDAKYTQFIINKQFFN